MGIFAVAQSILAPLATLLGLQGLSGCGNGATCFSLTATSEDGQEVAINNPTLGGDEIAQKFVTVTAVTATAIKMKLKRAGSLTSGSIVAYIVADNAGQPATVTGADPSATLTLTALLPTTSTFTVYTANLSTSVALTAATTYWIRIKGVYGQSGTDYVAQAASNLNGYTTGNAVFETSTPDSFGSGSLGANRDLAVGISCQSSS